MGGNSADDFHGTNVVASCSGTGLHGKINYPAGQIGHGMVFVLM
jgi:hypothetical protein